MFIGTKLGIYASTGVAAFVNEYSLDFDGVDEYLEATSITPLLIPSDEPQSLSIWFKATNETDDRGYLWARANPNGHQTGILLRLDYYGVFEFIYANSLSGNVYARVSVNAVGWLDDAWHNIVCTYDGSEDTSGMTIYVDGSDASASSTKNTLSITSVGAGTLRFGISPVGNQPYLGKLEEASFWDKELSSGEADEIYNSGLPTDLTAHSAAANLIGWWRMGDGATYPTIPDASTNSSSGSMENMESGDINTDVPT